MTVPCIACGTPFERKKRGPIAHHCPTCREGRKRVADRERLREIRAGVEEVRSRLPEEVSISTEDFEELGYVLGIFAGKVPMVQDRMPPGSKTPAGSDDGRSTWFTDLAGELDHLGSLASRHPWWDEHPHWCFGL